MTLRDDAAGAKPATRLYVDADLAAGRSTGLDPERAHYLRHVLRLTPGERVALFNGRDGEWLARIDGFGKGWCSLSIETRRRPQDADRDLWLGFGPVKRARLDFLAGKARARVREALAALVDAPGAAGPRALMPGPEGGFAPSELDGLGKLPFVTPVGLGPRLLRADTAAVAALACWQAILGDGRARPAGPEDAAS